MMTMLSCRVRETSNMLFRTIGHNAGASLMEMCSFCNGEVKTSEQRSSTDKFARLCILDKKFACKQVKKEWQKMKKWSNDAES